MMGSQQSIVNVAVGAESANANLASDMSAKPSKPFTGTIGLNTQDDTFELDKMGNFQK